MRRRKEFIDGAMGKNQECYALGCKFYNAGRFNKALTLFKESIEYWPDDAMAWMAVGNCYDALNRPRKAEKALLAALACAESEDVEPLSYNLANSYFDQGRYTEAVKIYQYIKPGSQLWRVAQRNVALAGKRARLTCVPTESLRGDGID